MDRISKMRTANPHANPSHWLSKTVFTHSMIMRSTATHCQTSAASSFLRASIVVFESVCRPARNQTNDATMPPITQWRLNRSDHALTNAVSIWRTLIAQKTLGQGLGYTIAEHPRLPPWQPEPGQTKGQPQRIPLLQLYRLRRLEP